MKKLGTALIVVLSILLFTSCLNNTNTPGEIIEPRYINDHTNSPVVQTHEDVSTASETPLNAIPDGTPQSADSQNTDYSTPPAVYYKPGDGIPPYGFLDSDLEVFGIRVGMKFVQAQEILQQEYGDPNTTKNTNYTSSGKIYIRTSLYYDFAEFNFFIDKLDKVIITNKNQQVIRGIKIGDSFDSVLSKFPNNANIKSGDSSYQISLYRMEDETNKYAGVRGNMLEYYKHEKNYKRGEGVNGIIFYFENSVLINAEIFINYI